MSANAPRILATDYRLMQPGGMFVEVAQAVDVPDFTKECNRVVDEADDAGAMLVGSWFETAGGTGYVGFFLFTFTDDDEEDAEDAEDADLRARPRDPLPSCRVCGGVLGIDTTPEHVDVLLFDAEGVNEPDTAHVCVDCCGLVYGAHATKFGAGDQP